MSSSDIVIRQAELEDAPVLARFNIDMARETESKTLDASTIAAGVRALFADPGKGFYLVAEIGRAVAGALMVTREWSDWRNGDFWWIQSVYVAPPYRRRGVYRGLHEAVRARAAEHDEVCGLRLYVKQSNARAQASYRALGMGANGYLVYEELITRY
jgi:ribosomal protein S18 acetylase RimI-like enzyme